MNLSFDTPVAQLPLVGPIFARRLKRLEIKTAEDLLYHFPFRYEDYSVISTLASLQPGETVTVCGTLETIKNEYTRHGKKIQKAQISDGTDSLPVIWYNQPYLVRTLRPGQKVNFSGKIDLFGNKLIMEVPDFELIRYNPDGSALETIHTGRLVPIYPETSKVSSKWLRSRLKAIFEPLLDQIEDYLPIPLLRENNFLSLKDALSQIHFPKNMEMVDRSRARLAYDELFLLHIGGLKIKREWEREVVGHPLSIAKYKTEISRFWDKIPFDLTGAQNKAVREIFTDLAKSQPMNRLLEGDVGSGKTVVAAIAMYISFLNGYQAALMAPTEILAFQHFETISKFLTPLGLKVALSTGSKKIGHENSHFNIIVGTHALLSRKLELDNLGLIIIDEQHRFGVEQRAQLRQKGTNPHLLTLTATPIPRTVALTLYGELDLSFLNEMPPGRKVIKTWVVPEEKRQAAYRWIEKQIGQEKIQAFIICPFIEESETLSSVKAATKEYEHLQKEILPDFKIGLLHGKMKSKEKEAAISDFKEGKIDILVATPVVEVGIDIPAATIMLIDGAERFGLAQLHQLRGRVGRSSRQSYCLLFTESPSYQVNKRLKAMESYHSGADLAELDLKLRGPGELYGTRQHGLPQLKIASFSDFDLIEKTRADAQKILGSDLDLYQYPLLKAKLKKITITKIVPD